jgi:hypothetical protein
MPEPKIGHGDLAAFARRVVNLSKTVAEAFCRGPWPGRPASMSWFVLNSWPGGGVVSFYATARLTGRPTGPWRFVDNKLRTGVVRGGSTVRWTGALASLASSRYRVRF